MIVLRRTSSVAQVGDNGALQPVCGGRQQHDKLKYLSMAEREGFEPSIRFCRILTFQASAFDHSATAPPAPGRVHNQTKAWKAVHLRAKGETGKVAGRNNGP